MTERLVRTFPSTSITAIDISPKVGRLFKGSKSNVTFRQVSVDNVAEHSPSSFDLVLLADVLHHVPNAKRLCLLEDTKKAMKPNGRLVFKDWLISKGPIHWICSGSDRYLTGDTVSYFRIEEARSLLEAGFGKNAIQATGHIRPWRNNFVMLVAR
jgi:SAM-dependent methyltransferase